MIGLSLLPGSPTHSLETEGSVLGSALLDAGAADELLAKAKVDWFYDGRHQNIFSRIGHLRAEGRPADVIGIVQAGPAAEVGGIGFVAGMPDLVTSVANLPYHLTILKAKADRRRLLRAAEEIKHHALSEADDETALESAGQILISTQEIGETGGEVTAKQAVLRAIDEMEKALERGSGGGVQTGYRALDRLTGGLHASEMVVLAARPSMGKTSLAMNIVEHAAMEGGISVGVLSLEMTSTSLMMRMLSGRAGVDLHRIRDGSLTQDDKTKLVLTSTRLAKARIIIDDTPSISPSQFRACARRMKSRHGIGLLVVDYLQLLHAKAESRTQEITQISSAMKACAKELGLPVLVLSQLSRAVEQQDRSPRLSDLRESGAIEQDADVVLMLHRPDAGNRELVQVIVAKQRNGPTGSVELTFDPSTTRFKNPEFFSTSHEVD